MRIEAAKLRRFQLRLRTPLATGLGPLEFREGVLLRLLDTDGCCGYGEATPLEAFGTEPLDALVPVAGDLDLHAVLLEQRAQLVADRGAVVYDQDAFHLGTSR